MKNRLILFLFAWIMIPAGILCGEETSTEMKDPSDNAGIDEVLTEKGVYRPLGEYRVNLRIEEQQFRVYVVDQDHVVQEPDFESVLIEVLGQRGRNAGWRGLLEREGDDPYLSHPRELFGLYRFPVRMIIRYPGDRTEAFGRVLFDQEKS